MQYLDHHVGFDQTEATPFLLLDGHGSRFGLSFLEYINDAWHEWAVCIGVPYGTSLWQVGDSSQQNGAFKIALKKAKQFEFVINEKAKLWLPCKIEKHDIVRLMHWAWLDSFAWDDSNKTATSEWGWGPLAYNLLDHEELKCTKNNKRVYNAYQQCKLTSEKPISLTELNLTEGISGTIMDQIVEYKCWEWARDDALCQ